MNHFTLLFGFALLRYYQNRLLDWDELHTVPRNITFYCFPFNRNICSTVGQIFFELLQSLRNNTLVQLICSVFYLHYPGPGQAGPNFGGKRYLSQSYFLILVVIFLPKKIHKDLLSFIGSTYSYISFRPKNLFSPEKAREIQTSMVIASREQVSIVWVMDTLDLSIWHFIIDNVFGKIN